MSPPVIGVLDPRPCLPPQLRMTSGLKRPGYPRAIYRRGVPARTGDTESGDNHKLNQCLKVFMGLQARLGAR